MLDEKVLSILNDIADSIKEAGLDPHKQLYGFATTGNERYITRHRDARDQIKKVHRKDIAVFLHQELKPNKNVSKE